MVFIAVVTWCNVPKWVSWRSFIQNVINTQYWQLCGINHSEIYLLWWNSSLDMVFKSLEVQFSNDGWKSLKRLQWPSANIIDVNNICVALHQFTASEMYLNVFNKCNITVIQFAVHDDKDVAIQCIHGNAILLNKKPF